MTEKEQKYALVAKQAAALIDINAGDIANYANICALLHGEFGFWWTGVYLVKGDYLELGPFQGPVACTRIPFGKGVCGTAWKENRSVVVPDVDAFPGHIACSSESRSEIVVPLRQGGIITGVLDIDSKNYAAFDEIDAAWLERICGLFDRD